MTTISKHSVIGITSGCFDLPHPLHVEYLTKCRRQCDHLIVLVDSDRLVTQNKRVPVLSEQDRLFMIQNLKPVDEAHIFDNLHEFKTFIAIHVEEYVKVKVFKNDAKIYGADALKIDGAELVLVPDTRRFASTTDIINHLKSTNP